MNELEISLWSLYLESTNKKDLDQSTILLLTAYQAKVVQNFNNRNILIQKMKVIFTIRKFVNYIPDLQVGMEIGSVMNKTNLYFLLRI